MIHVGQRIELSWNGAKFFSEGLAHETVRVEAVGIDWIVIRAENGEPYAFGFARQCGHDHMWKELTEMSSSR